MSCASTTRAFAHFVTKNIVLFRCGHYTPLIFVGAGHLQGNLRDICEVIGRVGLALLLVGAVGSGGML